MVVVVLHCGSRSPTRTRCPSRAAAAARLTVVVVLPTPPFWLPSAIRFGRFERFGLGLFVMVMAAMLARPPAQAPGGAAVQRRVRAPARTHARQSTGAPSCLDGRRATSGVRASPGTWPRFGGPHPPRSPTAASGVQALPEACGYLVRAP